MGVLDFILVFSILKKSLLLSQCAHNLYVRRKKKVIIKIPTINTH